MKHLEIIAALTAVVGQRRRIWEISRPFRVGSYWILLILPAIAWINGPAVSEDQRMVRAGIMVTVAFISLVDFSSRAFRFAERAKNSFRSSK